MKNFYNQIFGSIYNPKFYSDLKTQDASFTIFYLLKLSCLTAILGVAFSFTFFHRFEVDLLRNSGAENLGSVLTKYVDTYFADDLVVSFKNGHLSTNKTQPVVFPIPDTWIGEKAKQGELNNFLVLDPAEEFSGNLFSKYSAYAVFASSSVGYYDQNQTSVRTFDYADASTTYSDLVINKDLVLEKANTVSNYINKVLLYVEIIFLIFAFLGCVIFLFVLELIFALFTALISFIVSKLMKLDYRYGDWYLRAIHADTLYILLNWTLGWFVSLSGIFLLNTVIVLLVLYFNDNFKK